MALLHDPPRGISAAADPGGVTLRWSVQDPVAARLFGAAFLTFWLCGWAFGWVAAASAVPAFLGARGIAPVLGLFVLGWLCAWTVGGWYALRTLWTVARPGRPESVRLEPGRLVYDPGRGTAAGSGPAVSAERTEVAVDRSDNRVRLRLDVPAGPVEIGAALDELQQQWLCAVIRNWLSGPAPVAEPVEERSVAERGRAVGTTDEPAAGEITETADASGVTFAWPAYKSPGDASHAVARWAFATSAVVWAVVWVFAVASAVGGSGFLWPIVWTASGAAFFWFLRRVVLPTAPELVRLDAGALRYDPGRGPDSRRSCAELPDGKVVPVTPAPAFEVPKSAVRGFGIDRVNGRQRLIVDTDGRRFEIGGCLTESERAWLFAALQRWLGKPVAPPWSRAARHKEEAQP